MITKMMIFRVEVCQNDFIADTLILYLLLIAHEVLYASSFTGTVSSLL